MASFAVAQPLENAENPPASLVDDWRQGVVALEQAAKNLQKTNTLLSYENARIRAHLQELVRQAENLSTQISALTVQKEQLRSTIEEEQEQAMLFLERASSIDKKIKLLHEEKNKLVLLVDKEKELDQDLRTSTAQLKKDIETLEKKFFSQQHKERQGLLQVSQGQEKISAWLRSQEVGLRQISHDLKIANQRLLACYVAQKRLMDERQQIEHKMAQDQEIQDPSMTSESSEDLQRALAMKKQELGSVLRDPADPMIASLRADVESLRGSNRDLKEILSHLRASLKQLKRQKSSLEKTLLKK